MAGDWIKMRGNLWDDPRVARICDLTDSAEGPVIGALYWLWATADQHSEDGAMPGLTLRQIDRKTGLPGFAAALCEIGWLTDAAEGVVIQKFEEHNGTSAKRRCTDAQRKANSRNVSASDADNGGTEDGQKAPKPGAREREEKRREIPSAPTGADAAAGAVRPKVTDPDEIIFGYGVPLLTAAGSTDKHARSFLGGLRKVHGDAPVIASLRECMKAKPLQPLEWLAAALPPRAPPGKQTALEQRNAATAERLAAAMNLGEPADATP